MWGLLPSLLAFWPLSPISPGPSTLTAMMQALHKLLPQLVGKSRHGPWALRLADVIRNPSSPPSSLPMLGIAQAVDHQPGGEDPDPEGSPPLGKW